MTCHADLSVDEVVLDLNIFCPFYGLSVNILGLKFMPRFLHTSINKQLMTCRECHLICHDDKMPPQFIHDIFYHKWPSLIWVLPGIITCQDITYFSKGLTFCLWICLFVFVFFIKCEKSISKWPLIYLLNWT